MASIPPLLGLPSLPRIRVPTIIFPTLNLPGAPTPAAPYPSPAQLMSLGMFIFGMDTLPYQKLTQSAEWRHAQTDRHQAPPASQFLGRGQDKISISGLCVPEIAGDFGAFDTLVAMGDTGDDWPLMDGIGRIFGNFRIVTLEREHLTVMAGGLPRHIGFTIELQRAD